MKKYTPPLLNDINLVLIYIQVLLLIILVATILTYKFGVLDPFILDHIAGLEYSASSSPAINFDIDLFIDAKYVPGYLMFIYIFPKILGVSHVHFAYIPLGITLLCFSVFMFEWELLKRYFSNNSLGANNKIHINSQNNLMNSLLIAISIFFIILPDHYTIWNHTIGTFLYIIAVYVFFTKVILEKNPKLVLIFLLLFIAISLFSYSRQLWITSFVLLFVLISSIVPSNLVRSKNSIAILVIMLGLIIGQRTLLRYVNIILSSQYYNFGWRYIMSNILGFSSNEFAEYYVTVPRVYMYFILVFFVVLLSPYFLYFKKCFKTIIPKGTSDISIIKHVFILSFLLVFIFDAIAYIRIGAFFVGLTRYLKFAAILLVPMVFYQINCMCKGYPKRVIIYVVIILLLLLPQYYYNIEYTINKDPEKLTYLEYPWEWYYGHQIHRQSKIVIYSDHYTQAALSILGAKDKIMVSPYLYTPILYRALVNPKYTDMIYSKKIIFINKMLSDQPTKGNGWTPFKPVKTFYYSINGNKYLDIIYNSDKILILRGV
ncbi:hypothetical protein [Thermococcus litoralis]|uniref:hypothetical protein n=1 Tax=Thermococcus litoralis TaxID=2265 RepID=UPI000B34B902|nr:hypothetical protein [Thermococcus litoralis]